MKLTAFLAKTHLDQRINKFLSFSGMPLRAISLFIQHSPHVIIMNPTHKDVNKLDLPTSVWEFIVMDYIHKVEASWKVINEESELPYYGKNPYSDDLMEFTKITDNGGFVVNEMNKEGEVIENIFSGFDQANNFCCRKHYTEQLSNSEFFELLNKQHVPLFAEEVKVKHEHYRVVKMQEFDFGSFIKEGLQTKDIDDQTIHANDIKSFQEWLDGRIAIGYKSYNQLVSLDAIMMPNLMWLHLFGLFTLEFTVNGDYQDAFDNVVPVLD